jgi:hypothetical protein
MSEGTAWRRFITIWVAVACVTAVLCCWLLSSGAYRAARYEIRQSGPNDMRFHRFDRETGKLERLETGSTPVPAEQAGVK